MELTASERVKNGANAVETVRQLHQWFREAVEALKGQARKRDGKPVGVVTQTDGSEVFVPQVALEIEVGRVMVVLQRQGRIAEATEVADEVARLGKLVPLAALVLALALGTMACSGQIEDPAAQELRAAQIQVLAPAGDRIESIALSPSGAEAGRLVFTRGATPHQGTLELTSAAGARSVVMLGETTVGRLGDNVGLVPMCGGQDCEMPQVWEPVSVISSALRNNVGDGLGARGTGRLGPQPLPTPGGGGFKGAEVCGNILAECMAICEETAINPIEETVCAAACSTAYAICRL